MRHDDRSTLDVAPVLEALRGLTGMDVAYLSEFRHGEQVICAAVGDVERVGPSVGETVPLESTFCQRVVDGRLPGVVPDIAADPVARVLVAERAAPLGAYLGVPLRTASGRLHGTLCCLAAEARPGLGATELKRLEGFADVLGHALSAEEQRGAAEAERLRLATAAQHALRTPVMAIDFLAEDLAAGGVDVSVAARALTGEAATLSAIIDGLAGGEDAHHERREDVCDLARRAAGEVAARLGAVGRVRIRLDDEALVGRLDGVAILRSVRDLVDNALRHGGGDGRVEVVVERDGPTALVTVVDHGAGIAPERLAEVRAGFARAAGALDEDIRGLGFGLAGAQRVAEEHEGTLSITETPGGGAAVALRVPLR